jgi:hypothetical protein
MSKTFKNFMEVFPYIEPKIAGKKEVWFAFDMDETLAYWGYSLPDRFKAEKDKPASIFYDFIHTTYPENKVLRPSVIPFLKNILNTGVILNFAIYSNTSKQDRTVKIAEVIKEGLNKGLNKEQKEELKKRFNICFLFHNKFKGNADPEGTSKLSVVGERLNINRFDPVSKSNIFYRPNKTYTSIEEGYSASGHTITDKDVFFFFDDVLYKSIKDEIGENYILMDIYNGKGKEEGYVTTNISSSSGAVYAPPSSSSFHGKRTFSNLSSSSSSATAVKTTATRNFGSLRGPAKPRGGRRRTRRTLHRSKKTQRARRSTKRS